MPKLQVHGYRNQTGENIRLVNENKLAEERLLRLIEQLESDGIADRRWLAIARTHIEQGYMALNRAIFKPARTKLE